MHMRIRMAAVGLSLCVLLGLCSGCSESVKSVSGASLTAEDYTAYSSKAAPPQGQPYAASADRTVSASSALSPLPSDISSVRRMFLQSLKATNKLTDFQRTATRTLKVGQVELVKSAETCQSASDDAGVVQLTQLEASYKTETAQSRGLESRVTYLEDGIIYTLSNVEDSLDASNNQVNTVTSQKATEPEDAVPSFYLDLTERMIRSVDVSQSGSDVLYSITLDSDNCREQVINLLQKQPFGLTFDKDSFQLDYNVCSARSNADGLISEITTSISGRYQQDGQEQSSELTIKYVFSQPAAPPERPAWADVES